MWRTWGRAGDPVAVLLPGAASTADFVTRVFGPPLRAAGYALVTTDPVAGPEVVTAAFATLDWAAGHYPVRVVGGISLGAQVAARWAAQRCAPGSPPDGRPSRWLDGLLLALPAWTGPTGPGAAACAAAAAEVARYGPAGALERARSAAASHWGVHWVIDEVAAAWPRYGAQLAATLAAAAAAAGPAEQELAALDLPVGLAGFVDDPLHPLAVAEQWAALLPRARLERLRLADAAADRAALGAAAVRAWQAATARPAPTPLRRPR